MKRTPRKPRPVPARDPLFNSSVQKALAMLETFGGERRALSLAELAAGVGMTTSSAQRCTHTLVRLGFLRRDARARRWVLTPRALSLAHAYLAGHALLEQATTHLIDLNQASGESVSLSEPDGADMVFIARFPIRSRY
jgi:IclR family pca regulon transcriptional regulator